MQSSKLINLLKTFSKDEMNRFEEFVSSPYFNKNSNTLKLLMYIEKYSGNYESIKLNRDEAYSKIFPGKSYNNKVMKNLMGELLKLGWNFLAQYGYEKNKDAKYHYLLKELLNRNQYLTFADKVKSAGTLLNKPGIGEGYFYNSLLLDDLKHSLT